MPALFGPRPQGLGAQPSGGLGGFMERATSFRDQNPGALTALGAGIMAGNPAAGFAAVAPVVAQGRRQNATAQFLLTKGIAKTPEEAMTLASEPALIKLVMKDPDEYTQRAEAAERYGLPKGTPEFNNFVLGMDQPGSGQQETWGVTPIWGKNAKGEDVLGVNSDRGNFKPLDTGSDFKPMGTGDKAYDRAYQGGLGKSLAEATSNYRSITSKMPGLESTVKQLHSLSDQATYTPGGKLVDTAMRWADMEPRDAAVARTKYMAIVDNQVLPMLRDTFGAQFTVQEGESLRATLGAPDATPAEKKAVLDAFIEQKRRNIEAMAEEAGITGGVQPAVGGGNTRLRFNPATGELE